MTTTRKEKTLPRWSAPVVEPLEIDLRAVAQGSGSTMDMHKAANARASR